jgi:hypothetical protein
MTHNFRCSLVVKQSNSFPLGSGFESPVHLNFLQWRIIFHRRWAITRLLGWRTGPTWLGADLHFCISMRRDMWNFSQNNHKQTCALVVKGCRVDAWDPRFESLRVHSFSLIFRLVHVVHGSNSCLHKFFSFIYFSIFSYIILIFSSRVFFPSPHAQVGWVRGMIFFPNFVSKPATTIQPNWACLFFFLQKCRWV